MAACGLRMVVLLLLCVSLCCSQNAGQSSVVTDIRWGGHGEQGGQEDGQGILWHRIAAYREGSTELPSTAAPPNPTTQQFGAIPPVPDPEDAECFVTKGINQDLLEAYREVYQGLPSTTAPPTPTPQQFGAIPPLPNPEEVECFVEITTVQRRGGLCGQFGGGNGSSPYYCQRGEFTEMQPECGAIVRARTARAAARASPEARTPQGHN